MSSGEAEPHGINSGITQGFGLQSIAKDLGFDVKVRVHSDATAALGISRRRGLGKIKHLDVADLWAQDKVRSGAIELCKSLGAENSSRHHDKICRATAVGRDVIKDEHACDGGSGRLCASHSKI